MSTFTVVDGICFVALLLPYIIYNNIILYTIYIPTGLSAPRGKSIPVSVFSLSWYIQCPRHGRCWKITSWMNECMLCMYNFRLFTHFLYLLFATNMFRVFTLWMAHWLFFFFLLSSQGLFKTFESIANLTQLSRFLKICVSGFSWKVSRCGPTEPIFLLGSTHEARPRHLDRSRWF